MKTIILEFVRAGAEMILPLLIGSTVAGALGGGKPDTSAADAAAAAAKADADAALAQRQRAEQQADVAAAGDSEVQRRAAEKRLRTMLSQGGFNPFASNDNQPNVWTRQLMGA